MKWLQRPLPASLLLVLLWIIFRLAFLWHTGIPQPETHDEFSYLLQADTFAQGRLTNPSPPLGRFFESPHILVRPTYASKYPPGQAMFLALGQVLLGSPFYGVIIGNALMLFTFCMMLFAWVPAQWALAVSAMFGLVLSPAMYWTDCYWGGSVAASGGALVLLGVGMWRTRQTPMVGAAFAIGVLLLFFTRPFEGGVFTIMMLVVFGKELWRKRRAGAFVAAALVLAIGGAWTCYDNHAITRSPFVLPYVVYQYQYEVTPVFWFQRMRPPITYSNPRLAAMLGTNGVGAHAYKGERKGWQLLASHFVGPFGSLRFDLLAAILIMLLVPVAWGYPLYRKMCIVSGGFLLALGTGTYHQEHYTAPVWAALALLIAIWAERAWNLKVRKLRVGAALVLLALVSPAIFARASIPTVSPLLPRPLKSFFGDLGDMPSPDKWSYRRTALIQRLSALDRRQLVIVRYPYPSWNVFEEWVYNGADIDHQRVIFAHDLGTEQNRALLAYYPDRTPLLLTIDPTSGREKIEPYPLASSRQ